MPAAMLNATHSLIHAQTLTLDNSYWLRPCSKVRALRRDVRCFCERSNPSTRPQEYIGSDGRRKATIEEAFSTQSSEMSESHGTDGRTPPWGISWQTAERNLEWNDDIKHRLLKRVTAENLGVSEEELTEKLEMLQQLLPNLLPVKMAIMGPSALAQLAADPAQLTQKLVALKGIFPGADTSRMVSNDLSLLLKADIKKVAAAADELRAILPNVDVDKLVEDNPGILHVESFKKTIQHAKEIMGPDLDVIDTLKRRPEMIFQFQQGKDLIPYDEVPTQKS